jgi:N-acetylglucosaminyldiphosphoundecaprenol N-acetyl-beta-D-mannosaminyltransferase
MARDANTMRSTPRLALERAHVRTAVGDVVGGEHQSVSVGGVAFAATDVETLIRRGPHAPWDDTPSFRFANAYCIALAQSDAPYRDLLNGPGTNFPDGLPVATLMRLRSPEARQIRGPSFFEAALGTWVGTDCRHFLLGSTPDVLGAIRQRAEAQHPLLEIVGEMSPPFRDLTDADFDLIAARIRASDANVVWIGMGTPKQDFVALRLVQQLDIPCFAVGAAFDFYSGMKATAPPWMQRAGLEWLFRLCSEPRRLWRRYLWGNSAFLIALVKGIR